MCVEGGDFVDFGLAQAQFVRERAQMSGGNMPVSVLDEMKKLNEKITASLGGAQQGVNLALRCRIDLAALGQGPRRPPT